MHMKLDALAKAITLATLLSVTSFGALAADIPLSAVVEADSVTTKVLAVDPANHRRAGRPRGTSGPRSAQRQSEKPRQT